MTPLARASRAKDADRALHGAGRVARDGGAERARRELGQAKDEDPGGRRAAREADRAARALEVAEDRLRLLVLGADRVVSAPAHGTARRCAGALVDHEREERRVQRLLETDLASVSRPLGGRAREGGADPEAMEPELVEEAARGLERRTAAHARRRGWPGQIDRGASGARGEQEKEQEKEEGRAEKVKEMVEEEVAHGSRPQQGAGRNPCDRSRAFGARPVRSSDELSAIGTKWPAPGRREVVRALPGGGRDR